jgi:hypothetical protein
VEVDVDGGAMPRTSNKSRWWLKRTNAENDAVPAAPTIPTEEEGRCIGAVIATDDAAITSPPSLMDQLEKEGDDDEDERDSESVATEGGRGP